MKTGKITQDKAVYFLNYIFLTVILIAVIYPLIYVVSCSFSSGVALMSGKVRLFPVGFTLESYKAVFACRDIWVGYRNSMIYTAVGTVVSLTVTVLAAYPLSRSDFQGRGMIMHLLVFTMMFSGGLIPNYMLIKNLKLIDSMWALVLPGALGVYNVIVARTFFCQNIPTEILEAAQMDGCSDFYFFLKIVLPLSKSILAVLCLWIAVGSWNSYFSPMIYLNSEEKYTLQLVLRRILILSQVKNESISNVEEMMRNKYLGEMLKYGTIIISTLPLMVLYPFIQKHFTKGVMIGSVKG